MSDDTPDCLFGRVILEGYAMVAKVLRNRQRWRKERKRSEWILVERSCEGLAGRPRLRGSPTRWNLQESPGASVASARAASLTISSASFYLFIPLGVPYVNYL